MGSWYLIIVGHPSGAQLELHVQREDTNRRWQDLAVNARDAMPVGGTIKIATGNVNRDKKYAKHHPPVVPGPPVMLSFSDTGHGIDKQLLPKIFEPFFTTKESGKGTGLVLRRYTGL